MYSEQGLSTSSLGFNPTARYSSSEYSSALVTGAASAHSHAISRASRAWMANGGNDGMGSPTIEQDLLQQDGRRDLSYRLNSSSSVAAAHANQHSDAGAYYPSASLSPPLNSFASHSHRTFSAKHSNSNLYSSDAATNSTNRRHTKWRSGSESSPGPSPPYTSVQPQAPSSSLSSGYYATSSHPSSSSASFGTNTSQDSAHSHHHHHHHHHHSHPYRSPRRHHAALPQHQHQPQQPQQQYHYQRGMQEHASRPSPTKAAGWQHSREAPTHHRSGSDGSTARGYYYSPRPSSPRLDHYSRPGPYEDPSHPSRPYERRSSNSGQTQSSLPQRRSFGTLDSAHAQYGRDRTHPSHYYTSSSERSHEASACIACRMTCMPCDGRFPCGPCASTNTRCMYQQQQHRFPQRQHQDSGDSVGSSRDRDTSPSRHYYSEVDRSDHHMEIESWEGPARPASGGAPSPHQSHVYATTSSGHLPSAYHPPHHPMEARRRSSGSPPQGRHYTSSSAASSGHSYGDVEARGFQHPRQTMPPGASTIPPPKSHLGMSSISPSASLSVLARPGHHAEPQVNGGKTTLPSIASLSSRDPPTVSMEVDPAHGRVSPGRSSSSPSPSPSYQMAAPSVKDPAYHFSGSDSSSVAHSSVSTHQSYSASQVSSSMQPPLGITAPSLVVGSSPSSSGPNSPHTGQGGPQRSQKQRPILPFANPHVSRARSTSSGSSSSSSASRPPVPPPSQPAMVSLSQGPSRNHPNRNNGPRRASYSHDPPNSTAPRSNRPPSPLPLIITLSSSSIRARKNALEMDNIQRASLMYTDFMNRVKESLARSPQTNQQGSSPADGAPASESDIAEDTTASATMPSTSAAAAAIATTYLDSIHSDRHESQGTDCFTTIPPPTIGFDPTAEAIVALEDLSKTGMLHAMIQRYFEWVHPQFMIFNKNHFLLRFWSQFGPFPEARELHAKLQHINRDNTIYSPMPDGLFTTEPNIGFLSKPSYPLSPLLLWSMVALVARHVDDREPLKAPIQESQKRVREGLALLNLADKENSQQQPQQEPRPAEEAAEDAVMMEDKEDSDKPAELGIGRTPEDYKDRGEQYFRWATELLKEQHAESSLVVVQSLLLLREYAVMAGLNSQASMYAGTAITMAMDLGWHKLKRPETVQAAAATSSSTSATRTPNSESTTSIATMGNSATEPSGISGSTTPSSGSSGSSGSSSTTITANSSSESSESSTDSANTITAAIPAKVRAAFATAVATSAMFDPISPPTSVSGQAKEQQVAEEEQRLCWGMCFIIDRWAAISAGRPFAIPIHVVDKSVFLAKPLPASQPQSTKDVAGDELFQAKMPGLQMRTKLFYEQQCRQALVIDEIQQFLMTWTEDLFVNTNSFDRLATALENWYRGLPAWMTLSSENGAIPNLSPVVDANKPDAQQDQGESAPPSLRDIIHNMEWAGSAKGPEAKQLESLNKDISLATLMDISYHTVRILLHRPFLRTNLRHPPCSPARASYACAQSANAITGHAEQLLNHTVLSPSLLMRHLFSMLTAAGIQLTNANLEDEPRLSTPARINLLKSIRVLRDSDRTSIGHLRFIAILEEFFPNQMKVMYRKA